MHIRFNGRDYSIYSRDDPSSLGVFREIFSEEQYASVKAIGDVHTVLDLGANIGISTLYFHALFPSARFVCVEAHDDNFQLLKRNIEANGIDAVPVHAAVVGSGPERLVELYVSHSSLSHSLYESEHTDAGRRKVRSTTIRDLLERNHMEEVGLLKCDIEGAEMEVLQRLGPEVLTKIRNVTLEYHSTHSRDILSSFFRPGYRLVEDRSIVHGVGIMTLSRRT